MEIIKLSSGEKADELRIELFAREKIEGWDAWGNEVPNETQRLITTNRGAE